MGFIFEGVGISNLGLVRLINEDSGLISQKWVAVADGLGGHNGGEVASRIAISKICANLKAHDLFNLVVEINNEIAAESKFNSELSGMGTTLSLLNIYQEKLYLSHIGDSRIYQYKKNTLMQLTHDDSVLQELLDQGRINADEVPGHPARAMLTHAILGEADTKPKVMEVDFKSGDLFLLATDGLTSILSDIEIKKSIDLNNLKVTLEILERKVLEKGAPDNYTIILVKIVEGENLSPVVKLGAAID
jgi:protein phosphatase